MIAGFVIAGGLLVIEIAACVADLIKLKNQLKAIEQKIKELA